MGSNAAIIAFFEESESHLETMESCLLELEKESDNKDIINELFRAVHSLKGNSGLVGLNDIHTIAMDMETFLDTLRSTGKKLDNDDRDKLFNYLDKIKLMVTEAAVAEGIEVGNLTASQASEVEEPVESPDAPFFPDVEQEKSEPDIVENETVPEPKSLEEAKAEPNVQEEPKTVPQSSKPVSEKKDAAGLEKEKSKTPKEKTKVVRSFLTFTLGNERYGFDITVVKEILLKRHITRVPNSKGFLTGIMNLRGSVIPVIDAKRRLGFKVDDSSRAEGENVIIIEGEGVTTGVLVDMVEDIEKFDSDKIVSSAEAFGNQNSSYISGLGKTGKKTIMLLDSDEFCSANEKFY